MSSQKKKIPAQLNWFLNEDFKSISVAGDHGLCHNFSVKNASENIYHLFKKESLGRIISLKNTNIACNPISIYTIYPVIRRLYKSQILKILSILAI